MSETSTPGATGWISAGPKPGQESTSACQRNTAATPPSIEASAPCRFSRRQKTPSTTGTKKALAMIAVNSSTMYWTSSPSPTPLRMRASGAAPTSRMPKRAARIRAFAESPGRNTPTRSWESADPATRSRESTVDMIAETMAASRIVPRTGGSAKEAMSGMARSEPGSAGKRPMAASATRKTSRFTPVATVMARKRPRRISRRSRIA